MQKYYELQVVLEYIESHLMLNTLGEFSGR